MSWAVCVAPLGGRGFVTTIFSREKTVVTPSKERQGCALDLRLRG